MPNGYGKVTVDGKTWLAHRLMWTAKNGEIKDGLCVCHKCDNRKCINPDHLFLGSRFDNMQDMIAKGRAKFVGFLSPNFKGPRPKKGEENGRAVLNSALVEKIRAVCGKTNKSIAAEFGVSPATIQRVRTGANWC